MKAKWYIGIAIMLLVNGLQGSAITFANSEYMMNEVEKEWNDIQWMNTIEYLNYVGFYWEAIATPTNLILKPKPNMEYPYYWGVTDKSKATEALRIEREIPEWMWPTEALVRASRLIGDYIANNEDVILTPDREMEVYFNSYSPGYPIEFTPVSFKDQSEGFRVSRKCSWAWYDLDLWETEKISEMKSITKRIAKYVALSDDGPIEMTEDDVVDIMEWSADEHGNYSGDWKPYVKAPPAPESPRPEHEAEHPALTPEPESAPTPPVIASVPAKQPSVVVPMEGERPREPPHRPWIYIGALLILAIVGILYLRRKK